MQWYYVIDGERRGPVSPEELARLIAHGTVTSDTLVWREGLAAWESWGRMAEANPLPAEDASAPPPVNDGPAGVAPSLTGAARAWSTAEFSQRLEEPGMATPVSGCLRRAWENYQANFGLALGAISVAIIIMLAARFIPFAALLVSPHLMAGCQWLFLVRARGEPAGFDAIFEGFKRCYGQLVVAGLIFYGIDIAFAGLIMAGLIALDVPFLAWAAGEMAFAPSAEMIALLIILAAIWISLYCWLKLRFLFVYLVTLDRLVGSREAFALSWRLTRGRWGTLLGLMFLLVLLGIAGGLALVIGLVFVAPIYAAVLAQYYHDACESAAGRPPD